MHPLLLFDCQMLPWLLCPLPEETGLWHLDPAPCPLHLPPGGLHHPPGPLGAAHPSQVFLER